MTEISFSNVVIVAAVAFVAPLALGLIPRLRLPAVVLEIVLGIAIGPSGLGWVTSDLPVQVLALMGSAAPTVRIGVRTHARPRPIGRLHS